MAGLGAVTAPLAPGASDAAPAELAAGTPERLRSDLEDLIGRDQVLSRASDLIRYASDASPYRQIPKVVVQPENDEQVALLMAYAGREDLPLVFRAAGTSLCGQSQTDGILVDIRRRFRGIEVLEGGRAARAQSGAILGHVNRLLTGHGTKLGPDPASTDIATVGGVVANNSGGMRCGTTRDSYSTVRSLRFVLPSGTAIDTADPGAADAFEAAESELCAGLLAIRDEIRADADLRSRIARKFEIKNTMGYRLCAFLDADEPLEIFRRLLVGSEGTLAFISEATFDAVPVPPMTTVAWVHFPSIAAATGPVAGLVAAGATAVEMMVAPALMVAAGSIQGAPQHWLELPPDSAALLVEFGADAADGLAEAEARADELLEGYELLELVDWTRDPETIELNWRVREGMHGLIGKLRPPGTALVVEDVCVTPGRLAECAADLQELLTEHGFLSGVAGHASAGNLHFMLTPDFAEPEDLERYEAFMAKLVGLIVGKYDGSLKAEHGTGLNMAPFLEVEWGERAVELMRRIKQLADPGGVLAPGVLLNDDPDCHLQNLKTAPEIEASVTACVECGFCESICPSRDLTMTPRQRIVVRREIERQPLGSALRAALLEEYEYDGLQTCAADGSCAAACPLGIDTGDLVKEQRASTHSPAAGRRAEHAARRWGQVESAARAGLRAGSAAAGAVGDRALAKASALAATALGDGLLPTWSAGTPPAASRSLPATSRAGAEAVYLPACINRIFGSSDAAPAGWMKSVPEALVAVSRRAGTPVWIPPDVAGSCCGTPWSSKGYRDGHEWMANHTVERLWEWSRGGQLPIVTDASSCTQGFLEASAVLTEANRERHGELQIFDSIAWAAERLLEKLEVGEKLGSLTVHPTCSSGQLGLDGPMRTLAAALADEVVVPRGAACCGFAGDRGFLHPELTAAALADEAAEVAAHETDAYICANRTCEIGLERATGRSYGSFLYLLEELTRPGG